LEKKRKRDLLNAVYATPVDVKLAAEAEFESAEKTGGFQFLAACDDTRQGFVWSETEGVLAKDRALVQVGGYEVSGHADDFHSLVVRLAVGGGTGEGGEQRGMNI
jgi:hypothetical protein